ncbi:WecB/TagA/CpsF family glycosyltransferase [Botrimarina sp.]|uniref:WecB/TagA/CpsF family glycosyltransferase n=1 Tax=Botrimarina sp. TaxID=2795802 RepID=UPI0032EEF9D0
MKPLDNDPLAHRLPARLSVAGVALDPIDRDTLFNYVVDAAEAARTGAARRRTVGYLNVHVANIAHGDAGVARYLNQLCDLVYCDGRGVAWGARLQGAPAPPRMTAADWLPELLVRCRDEGLRVFVVAGREGVVDRALGAIAPAAGGLGPIASHDGYLSNPQRNAACLARLAEFAPDVVLVGMGTPHQERWVLAHRDRIAAPVVWTLGAAFDYSAGEQARGPAWLRRAGHEWAARLLADPARLWRRYVLGNPRFLWRAWRAGRATRPRR